ncbi:MAG TPA: prolyl oligopeptidase family serine peptidase, partial [Caldilineaceae bacterium]|nr:prolyl oligopeptidase family serine peptidase [Caldilineaceae bacterium]
GGYGKHFRLANRRDWGGGDYLDLQQGVDEVIALGIADPARLGVCGWSYGGFMTSWTITQTARFKAASIGAAVTNPMSFTATADIPSFIPDYFGCEVWEDLPFYQAHSPVFHAHKVVTPAIMQHGDADARVPLEQGLQYYDLLRRRGVPVEMYIYPRQGHAVSEPRLLADALQRNLDWFTEMLG